MAEREDMALDRKTLTENDLAEIKKIMAEGDQIDIEVVVDPFMGNIWFHGHESPETELYLKTSPLNGLIISRIALRNRRQGYGTRILNTLESYAIQHDFDYLSVEAASTIEICRLCEKLGYQKRPYNGFLEGDIFLGDWIKCIAKKPAEKSKIEKVFGL